VTALVALRGGPLVTFVAGAAVLIALRNLPV
jgi:uncharacterized membrane protein